MGYRIPSGDDIERRLPRAQLSVQRVSADGTGAAVAGIGAAIAEYGARGQEKEDRLDIARAKSLYITERIKAERELDDEPDYMKWGEKYEGRLGEIEQRAMGMIRSGRQQEQFKLEIAADRARAMDGVLGKQKGKWREHQVADLNQAAEDALFTLSTTDDEGAINLLTTSIIDRTDAAVRNGSLGADDAVRFKKSFGQRHITNKFLRRVEKDPEGALRMLQGGDGQAASGDYATKLGVVENGGRDGGAPNADSGAAGKFQFIDSTWLTQIRQHAPEAIAGKSEAQILALRTDPAIASKVFKGFTAHNEAALRRAGLPVNDATRYMAHWFGDAGAVQILNADPSKPIADFLPKGTTKTGKTWAEANGIEGMNVGQVKALAEKRMGVQMLENKTASIGNATPADGQGQSAAQNPPGKPNPLRSFLSPELELRMIAHAKRVQRERQTELQASAKRAAEDQIAAARETGRGAMPDGTFEAMIRAAYPERADADRILKTYNDEKVFHGVRQEVALASPEEEAELLKGQVPKVDPSQPAGFYDDQVKRRDLLVQAIQAKRKALADDPAAFVIGNSPAVREAVTRAAENPAQMPAAVSTLREAQTQLGVPAWRQRVLTQGQAADIVGRISATSTDENRADVMEGLRQTYGPKNWPSVMRDLHGAKIPPEFSILGRLTGPGDAQPRVDLSAAFATGRPALEKNLADTDKTTIKENLRSKTKDLRTSLFAQGGGAEFEQQMDATYMLSLQYVGKYGMSARDASAKAYDALIGSKWDFRDGYRTPKGQSREIGRGLDNIKAAISPTELMPAPSMAPGLTKDRIAEQTAYYAKRGTWVNNEDESGYVLRYPNGSFVLRPDGSRFEIGLKEAIDYMPKEDVTRPKSMPSLDIYPVRPR